VAGGINVGFVKRQGPQRDKPLFMPISITTVVPQPHRQETARPELQLSASAATPAYQ
jgi:hypothetical protein